MGKWKGWLGRCAAEIFRNPSTTASGKVEARRDEAFAARVFAAPASPLRETNGTSGSSKTPARTKPRSANGRGLRREIVILRSLGHDRYGSPSGNLVNRLSRRDRLHVNRHGLHIGWSGRDNHARGRDRPKDWYPNSKTDPHTRMGRRPRHCQQCQNGQRQNTFDAHC